TIIDNQRVCTIYGRDTHPSSRCPKLRPRKCYECGKYANHLAQECRDREAAQPAVTFEVTLDVEPFGQLDFVSIDDWAADESHEELEPVDEWQVSEIRRGRTRSATTVPQKTSGNRFAAAGSIAAPQEPLEIATSSTVNLGVNAPQRETVL
ncbi:hypothetical protein AAVH_42980, partial [Aphelenchoides avenae]